MIRVLSASRLSPRPLGVLVPMMRVAHMRVLVHEVLVFVRMTVRCRRVEPGWICPRHEKVDTTKALAFPVRLFCRRRATPVINQSPRERRE